MDYAIDPILLPCLHEPARSFPFLSDGEALYVVERWNAEAVHPSRFRVRRLTAAERRIVERGLRDAAEEAAYQLAAEPLSGRARRARRARS